MQTNTPTISEALRWARDRLEQAELAFADPATDSKVLLCHCLQCAPAYLHTWPDRRLELSQWQAFENLVVQRGQGIPVAHLTCERGFWNLSLKVSPKTLIPRSDTEVLVEKALSLFENVPMDVLDLGTGTGAIALALASERSNWRVTATDYDEDIVALARENAQHNGIDHVTLLKSHWFEALADRRFSLIVSNPPYVEQDSASLKEGDVRFEPLSALVAPEQGMADLLHIISHAGKYLLDSGYLVLEHGFEQAEKVQRALNDHGFTDVGSVKDYAGLDRVSFGKWLKKM
ncbi:peptide chain release factor N(5)-glutamine methyltransferase [Lacimicrobium sp. SS2-24]|uniref:peptide chain release factor N(5)-glutamine methyltransferase n=1 Tax=Lacimicrobium sp. SS2-24 TaxID=2005569 RepID=UPI000B4B9C01|nr:peptide chain release factor N(5)-glutamine methyltransferase [Lacimicrobium sp. SS2-24]